MLFSDDVVVRGARRLLLEQILQRDAIEIIADDPLQPLPHAYRFNNAQMETG